MEFKPNTITQNISFATLLICQIMLVLFILLSSALIIVEKDYLEKPETKAKFGALYLNLNYK